MTIWLARRWRWAAWLASPAADHALVIVLAALIVADVWLAAYLVCLAVGWQ